jgi:hypothetical protein
MVIKAGVYGMEGEGVLVPFAEGLAKEGVDVRWRRHDVFTATDTEDFTFVVVNGLRKHYRVIQQAYLEKGVPVLVSDYGYVRKGKTYYQTGFNTLGWIPEFACPPDRFKELDIPYQKSKSVKKGHILICGQMAKDAAHGLDEQELIELYTGIVKQLREVYPDNKIAWRPHPGQKYGVPGVDAVSEHDELKDAVEGCFFVATYNSTSGIEALTQGYPVLVSGGCFYSEISSTLTDNIVYPTKAAYEKFFSRLAYAQYTLQEIEDGLAAKFLLAALQGVPVQTTSTEENTMPEEKVVPETETPVEAPVETPAPAEVDAPVEAETPTEGEAAPEAVIPAEEGTDPVAPEGEVENGK